MSPAALMAAARLLIEVQEQLGREVDPRLRRLADSRPDDDMAARRLAAQELRTVAHRLDDGGDEAIEVALGGAAYVHRVLCDRAHELDGQHRNDRYRALPAQARRDARADDGAERGEG